MTHYQLPITNYPGVMLRVLLLAACFWLLGLASPARGGITVRETGMGGGDGGEGEPWRYAVTVTNDTADRTLWAVCVGGWGGSSWETEPAVLGVEGLPVNWRVDPLEDDSWHWIVIWSSVVGSDLPAGGVMTFDLVADRPLTMLEYTLQYGEGLNVAGVWAVPEPETGLLACAGIASALVRRRKGQLPWPKFEKRKRWTEEEMGWLRDAAWHVRRIRQQLDLLPCNPRAHSPERGRLHKLVAREIERLAALTGRTKAAVRWMVCSSKAVRKSGLIKLGACSLIGRAVVANESAIRAESKPAKHFSTLSKAVR